MSKKTPEMSLLVPGAGGWEVWKREEEGFVRAVEGTTADATEIEDAPSGEVTMLFPVRGMHALPFKAASTDESLFEDLAAMHAERLGIRPDPMAGQLTDSFVVDQDEESTTLLHVALRDPGEGDLPLRTPQEFDISARAFPVEGDGVAAWKEFGRWVFAIFSAGKLVYSGATSQSGAAPDAAFLREIHLALGQLSIQGLRVEPESVFVWPPEGELGEAGALADGLGVSAVVARRPDPVLPEPRSQLLPADVRAARRAKREKNRNLALIAAAALVYLGFIGWALFGYWQDANRRNKLAEQAEGKGEIAKLYQEHLNKWDSLGPVVEQSQNPVEIMLHMAKAMPKRTGLRLKTADIRPAEIKILGNAPQSAPVNAFALALKRNANLQAFDWETPAPSNSSKGWDFQFTGTLKGSLP